MLFGGLLLLFLLQGILYFVVDISGVEISQKHPRLIKALNILNVIISVISIIYVIILVTYMFAQKEGVYTSTGLRVTLLVVCIIDFAQSIIKLILYNHFRPEDATFNKVIMVLMIVHIFLSTIIITAFFLLLLVLQQFQIDKVLISENKAVVESFEYERLEVVKSSEKYVPYKIAVVNENGDINELELEIPVSVVYDENRHIEKYEIIQKFESVFENQYEKEEYQYIIYTPDENEENLINYYLSNLKN